MPPLGLHMVVARQIATVVNHPYLNGEKGSLYLGSTAPDIRIILRCDRERTHFFKLDVFDEQNGVAGLFDAYPHLAQPEKLSPDTVSFVVGYITHLVMDETWIDEVYRPYFGIRSSLQGDLRANVMDRALQYELDLRGRADRRAMMEILEELEKTAAEVDVGFIDAQSLQRWRQVCMDVASQPPTWERFRYIASRHLQEAGIDSPEAYEQFLSTLPALLAETMSHVGPSQVQSFVNRSVDKGIKAVERYLGCR